MGRPKKSSNIPNPQDPTGKSMIFEGKEKIVKDKDIYPVAEHPLDDSFIKSLKKDRYEALPNIKIALVREGAIFEKATPFAAGYDVKVFNMQIENGYIKFMLGIKSEIPEGWYAEVVHRSSNSKYDSILANTKGTIDSDFRGEWQARLKIINQPRILFPKEDGVGIQNSIATQFIPLWKEGETALQVIFHKLPDFRVSMVDESELSSTVRAEGGFGSTGS